MSTNYETLVQLPSKGMLYPDNPELQGDITLRMITTNEEKYIMGSTSSDLLNKLLKDCVVSPQGFNPDVLVPADQYFLFQKLRIHSYGDSYHIQGECPHCEASKEYEISLDDIPIHELPDDFTEPITMTLPFSKDEIGVRLLRSSDLKAIKNRAKKLSKELKIDYNELSYLHRIAKQIVSVNGEDLKIVESEKYVREMVGMDSGYIKAQMAKFQLGYDSSIEIICDSCGGEFEEVVQMTGEFFRPRYD